MAIPSRSTAMGIEGQQSLSYFEKIEREIRKKTFGIISTVDSKNRPHSTGIIFAISAPEDEFAIYVVTLEKSAKVKNIRQNPHVCFVITFPHHYLRFIPASTVMFRGTAELLPLDDDGAQRAFAQKYMTKANLDVDSEVLKGSVVIKIRPYRTVYVYGVGIGLNAMRKDPTSARYKVTIPSERLTPELSHAITMNHGGD